MPYVPAAIRYNNPGAQYPGPSASAFGSTGYGIIGGGHKIAQFPDPVSGAAAQFDLLTNGPYSKMPLGQAIRKWSGNNSSDAYIRSIADETGLDPSKPVTARELSDPNVAIPLAKAMAKFESGRDFPLADEDWQAAHSLAFGGGAPSAEPYASGSPAGGLPVQQPYSGLLDPNEEPPATGNPVAGNPMQASDMPLAIPGAGGNTDMEYTNVPTAPRNAQAAPAAAPTGPPTGNLPFGIPGTIGSNPIQQALGDNFSTLLAFAGGARQGGIGQGLTQAARASLLEGPENQKMKASRDQQLGIYNALRAKGLPHADAMSAAMSPEILKQMAPDVFGSAWKFEKVKDAFGGEVPVFVNPRSGEIRGQDGKPYNPGENPTTSPEAIDNTVKAVLEGRMAPPTSFAASKPYWQSILRRAAQVEPDFDLTKWQARQQGVKNFTSGKDAESVRAIDQTLHHMAALVGSAKELPGTNYPILNKVANLYNTQTGSDKENNFLLNAHAVAEEMSKVYKGGNLSDAEIRAWEQSLSPNMSEAQQRGAIRKLNELLQGGIHALEEKRLGAVGPAAAERMGPLLKPGAADKLKEIEGWLSPPRVGPAPPGNAPAAAPTATAPVTKTIGGKTYIQQNGQWFQQ